MWKAKRFILTRAGRGFAVGQFLLPRHQLFLRRLSGEIIPLRITLRKRLWTDSWNTETFCPSLSLTSSEFLQGFGSGEVEVALQRATRRPVAVGQSGWSASNPLAQRAYSHRPCTGTTLEWSVRSVWRICGGAIEQRKHCAEIQNEIDAWRRGARS
jgi:hypothetical protein